MTVHRPLALVVLAALGGAAEMNYANAPKDIVAQVPDLSATARVRFFVSADQGKTWNQLKDIAVPADAKAPPRLEFRPASDGSYLIATCAVYKKGAPEPEPKPGSIPANALALTIDTFKPAIGAFTAALERAEVEKAIVAVTWAASDAHFSEQPVMIEASTDGGASWPLSFPGAAQGSAKITVPTARTARAVLVRVSAKDRAGNLGVSDAQTIALPPPPDPEAELKKAVTSLPTVTEVAAQPAKASSATGASPEPARAAISATSASADPSKPDIIAPHAAEDALADPADGGEIVAPGPAFAESPTRAEPARPAAEVFKPQRGQPTAPSEEPAAAKASPVDEADVPFLPNPGAEVVLERAREQAKSGDRQAALATYRRLHRSGQAAAAIPEELALLGEMGDQRGIVDTVSALPPEYIGDEARLQQGRALVALGEQADALKALSRVRAAAPQAREAMWLIAKCFQAQGRAAEAKRVLATLAKGDDEWAQRAKDASR